MKAEGVVACVACMSNRLNESRARVVSAAGATGLMDLGQEFSQQQESRLGAQATDVTGALNAQYELQASSCYCLLID